MMATSLLTESSGKFLGRESSLLQTTFESMSGVMAQFVKSVQAAPHLSSDLHLRHALDLGKQNGALLFGQLRRNDLVHHFKKCLPFWIRRAGGSGLEPRISHELLQGHIPPFSLSQFREGDTNGNRGGPGHKTTSMLKLTERPQDADKRFLHYILEDRLHEIGT